MPILIGTSGWQYRDWRGVLYPPGLAQRRWLDHYAAQYATVENNGSFYRLPKPQTFASWRAGTPDGFVMAVKASRYLTHVRRLNDPAEPVERLLRAAAGLGDKLGPVLLQLPPNFPADPGALDACLREFGRLADITSGPVRVAVEFRHESWWTDEVREALTRHQAALCWADRLGRPAAPLWRTADWGYLRLHEGTAQPWPRYGAQALGSWVQRIAAAWPDDGADVFSYFNNDQGGAAVYDAATFASIARQAGRSATSAADPEPGPP
jgi:uncharacterized protein YecE (DUF72 family)